MEAWLRQLVLWQSMARGFFWLSAGTVYRGAARPPSMLRAKGAAGCYSASGRKNLQYRGGSRGSPSPTTADLLSGDRKRDMHSRCREADTHTHTPEGRQTGTDVSGQGHRQTQSSLEQGSRFQTPFWAPLINLRRTLLELNRCRGFGMDRSTS